MKPRISIIACLMGLVTSVLYAVPQKKTFISNGHILPGEEWGIIEIYNDGTMVNMLGGLVDRIETFDASALNVTGGDISTILALGSTIVNVSGGYVYGIEAGNHSTVNFSGNASALSIIAGSSGTINMAGGSIKYLRAGDTGTINLYDGIVSECLNAWDAAAVNIYGYGFSHDPGAGDWDGGQLTGFWLNDVGFSVDLYDSDTYDHINLVPEPASLLLFGFGSLILSRRRQSYIWRIKEKLFGTSIRHLQNERRF